MSGKFLFDNAFDGFTRGQKPAPPAERPTRTEAELAAACAAAMAQGQNAGLEQGRAEQAARLAQAVELIAGEMQGLGASQSQALAAMRQAAAQLALAIAARLAPALIARQPLVELEALIAECLAELTSEPRVVVRVAPMLVEGLGGRIDALQRTAAFPGEVIVLGDDAVAEGDCRVEWADGGAERDLGDTLRAIEERVSRAAALL